MKNQDIRWEQRLSNFKKALTKLEEGVNYIQDSSLGRDNGEDDEENSGVVLNNLIKQGLIQSFEFTHELAWNVIKDYAAYQGNPEIRGSRDASREGFATGLIENGEVWMEMIKSRNDTSHTYNEDTANEIFTHIIKKYLPAFRLFLQKMETIRGGTQRDIFS
ncbi:nucleotidyltransferase substrate binding protein [Lunatibacter salilacus]|uniref:nucleotidyltransferase substrate binding protein n=1 Tax=Lunatibacter salilacus TaxID=2483804 RepID=UPI00131E9710|nr:nucleotidyltransferase substrate binding protein [Lunatibacter salilacus]